VSIFSLVSKFDPESSHICRYRRAKVTLKVKDSVREPIIVEKNEFITMVILYDRMNRPIDRHSPNYSTLTLSFIVTFSHRTASVISYFMILRQNI
jgi:hypothetical protein